MTTRAQLRTSVRSELNDSGTPMFSDALLNEWINEAIRAYSRELPEEASATITVSAGTASYALPARTVQVMRVEQPQHQVRVPMSGSRPRTPTASELVHLEETVRGWYGGPPAYRLFAANMILDPAPTAAGATEDVRLEYLRYYAEPAADGDTLTTPTTDDEVLIWLVAASALAWVAGDEAKRLRYQEGGRALSPGAVARAYRERAAAAIQSRTSRLRSRTLEAS